MIAATLLKAGRLNPSEETLPDAILIALQRMQFRPSRQWGGGIGYSDEGKA
jgi:hypothetical protein